MTAELTETEKVAEPAETVKTFIGKNHDYFFRKWEVAAQRGRTWSWNWAAFLIGPVWLAYRKMYACTWMVLGVIAVESVVAYAIDLPDSVDSSVGVAIGVVLGMNGNHLYKRHVEKKVEEITAANRVDQVDDALRRRGGTSIPAIFGYIGILFLFVVTMTVIEVRPFAVTDAGYPECTSPLAAEQYKKLFNSSDYASIKGVQVDDVLRQKKISASSDGKTLVCQATVVMDDGSDMLYELTFTPAEDSGHFYVHGKPVTP